MLRGELTNLRAVERADDEFLHRWFNDPQVMAGWGLPLPVVSLAEVQRRIESWLYDESVRGWPSGLIVGDLEGTPVGLILLTDFRPEQRATELSLLIGQVDRWGEGLGRDALETALVAAFDEWGVHRIQLRCEVENERALRLYDRIGFQREGVLRESTWREGRFHDQVLLSMLSTEFDPDETS